MTVQEILLIEQEVNESAKLIFRGIVAWQSHNPGKEITARDIAALRVPSFHDPISLPHPPPDWP